MVEKSEYRKIYLSVK